MDLLSRFRGAVSTGVLQTGQRTPMPRPPRGVHIAHLHDRLQPYGKSGWRPDGLPEPSTWSEVDEPWQL